MKSFNISKKINIEKGLLVSSNEKWTIYNDNVTITDSNTGKVLGILLKNVITNKKLIQAGRNLTVYNGKSNTRADAAGLSRMATIKGNEKKKYKISNTVNSSVVGYLEKNNFHKCRKTALYRKHTELFDNETIKLIQYINRVFKKTAPKQYYNQMEFIKSINQNMVINKTCYTTLTVNKDFRTLTHRDSGDFNSGLGNITVFNYDSFTGGEFLLPEYHIGFNVQEGDILFVDVHQIHCNNKINGKGRISLVCYAREKILTKCTNVTNSQLNSSKPY